MQQHDQQEWYRAQQQLPLGSKRRFDDVVYEEKSTKASGTEDRERDLFQPYSEFKDERLAKNIPLPTIEQEWKDAVEGPNTHAIWARG